MRRPSLLASLVAGFTLTAVSAAAVSPALAEAPGTTGAAVDDAQPAPDAGTDPAADLPAYIEHYSRPFVIDGAELKLTQKYYWGRRPDGVVRPRQPEARHPGRRRGGRFARALGVLEAGPAARRPRHRPGGRRPDVPGRLGVSQLSDQADRGHAGRIAV